MPLFLENYLANPITLVSLVLSLAAILAGLWFILWQTRLFRLAFKNLWRNKVRTFLTALATMVLVFMITAIWTVVYFLDEAMRERSRDIKLIVTERWQIPSQMPMTHADYLDPNKPQCIIKDYIGPGDFMTWSFYGGSTDPKKLTRDNIIFFFAMKPEHIRSMMEDLGDLDPALIQALRDNRQGCLVGRDRLKMMNLELGGRFKVTSFNYKGIDLEFEVVGLLPDGRYSKNAIMNSDYFNEAMDKWAKDRGGKAHENSGKRLNLVWLRVKDRPTFEKVGSIIESSPYFDERPVKVEMASSLIGTFMEPFADLIFLVKLLLVPAILVIMALVNANAISISVRERWTEMAVLKVLGFRPNQVLTLVLGESLLIGAVSGFLSAGLTFALVDFVLGGIPVQIGFFPAFMVPHEAFYWGLAMGAGTALLGSFYPAWSARNVKVSEVFAKVA